MSLSTSLWRGFKVGGRSFSPGVFQATEEMRRGGISWRLAYHISPIHKIRGHVSSYQMGSWPSQVMERAKPTSSSNWTPCLTRMPPCEVVIQEEMTNQQHPKPLDRSARLAALHCRYEFGGRGMQDEKTAADWLGGRGVLAFWSKCMSAYPIL
jgi:hypothetical protein